MMLDGGMAGVLVRPGDAPALAEGILLLLKDSAFRGSLSDRAREVSKHYRWDRLVNEFAKVYEI